MQSTGVHATQVELIRSESQRLKVYFNTLPPDALKQPSPCEMWNVGEVIAHLVWIVETYGHMMERGLHGDVSPTEGFPSIPPGTPNPQVIIEEFYGQAAIDRRRSLGQGLISAFTEQYDWLNNVLAGIGAEDWDKPCYHSVALRSVESFMPTFLAELALHEWDIRSTMEPSTPVSEGIIPVLLEKIPGNRGRPWSMIFPATTNSPAPLRYRFQLSGIGANKLDVVVEDTKAHLETAVKAPANVSVNCDTGTFVLLMYGRQTLGSAMSSNRLTAEGVAELICVFDSWLEGK